MFRLRWDLLQVTERVMMLLQTDLTSPFSHFPCFAHRFLALPCKIMVCLLSSGREQSFIVSAIKKGLTTGERWLCYAVVLLSLCKNTPIEMHEGILGFGERPTALWYWAALVSGTKSEVVSVFCHWRSPQLSLDSSGLPLTILWGWLFLNKWVYDSDFLLLLLSFVINMEQHTPLREGTE